MATSGSSEALASSVLVLNRLYLAVHVVGVRRAFGLLCCDLAEIIHQEDGQFANFDFGEWRIFSGQRSAPQAASPRLDSQCEFRDPGAAGHPAAEIRPASQPLAETQPAHGFRPRRTPLPILRKALFKRRIEPRSRGPAKPGRRNHVGEHRLLLPELQRSQGWANPARGAHAAGGATCPPEAKSPVGPQTPQSQVRVLADMD